MCFIARANEFIRENINLNQASRHPPPWSNDMESENPVVVRVDEFSRNPPTRGKPFIFGM